MTELAFAFDTLVPFIMTGVVIGVFLAIVVGFARIGFKLAPWIVMAALIYYFVDAATFIQNF